ncbi:MAG: ribonuclease P protein component [Halieaceae bacterium]|nr:ribonuclease P protein component [Halieaceae bacterium]
MTLRFSSHHKLKKATDFSTVFNEASFRQSGDCILLLGKLSHQPMNRLGMVIAKKNIPRAVDRNKIKRVMREVFRNQPSSPIDTCLDIVLLVQGRIPKDTFGSLHQRLELQLKQLLKKANAVRERDANAQTSN